MKHLSTIILGACTVLLLGAAVFLAARGTDNWGWFLVLGFFFGAFTGASTDRTPVTESDFDEDEE